MLKQLIGGAAGEQQAARPGRILDSVPPAQQKALATCVLLVEMAAVDNDFDEGERAQIRAALGRHFNLDEADADDLVVMAQEVLNQSSDLWKFTNLLNEQSSRAEKIALIEEVWRVVYADGTLHHHEDTLAHRIGQLLLVPHPEVIAAKLRARGE